MTEREQRQPNSASGARALSPAPFLVGLGIVTGATLALEVLTTRLLSVLTWYSLAFLVIAMGLFGLTVGALRVYFGGDEFSESKLPAAMSRHALAFAIAIPLSYVLLLIIPLRSEAVATTVPLFLVFSAVIALPFYPAGIVVAGAVTRTSLPVGRVYAVDLIGAALGAPIVPLLLTEFDAGSAMMLVGACAAIGSAMFAKSGAVPMRGPLVAAAVLAAMAVVNGRSNHGLVPLWVKGMPEVRDNVAVEMWNSHSRVQVLKPATVPAMMWGVGTRCAPPMVRQRAIVIDGHAATPLYHAPGGIEALEFLKCDVTNVAHVFRPHGAVAVIGVGGSRDLQAALLTGHKPVVGIELNARLLEVLRSPLGKDTSIQNNPDVELVHDEARSYLARTQRKYTVIQASLIDTWAATGAGAHALGENGLYTTDAWRLFIRRLEPDGVFTVSRWANAESSRLVSVAAAALLELGATNPRQHIALVGTAAVTTLLVTRNPMSEVDSRSIERIAKERGFQIITTPTTRNQAERLNQMLDAKSVDKLNEIGLTSILDFRPSTDDRPFFFNVVRLSAFFKPLPKQATGTIEGNLVATRTLGLALLASLLFVGIAIIGPLLKRARPEGKAGRTLGAALVYFSAIGVGFMLAEIALLQRLSLVLGHPTYSLIVVLSSLVAAAGTGSLISDRLPLDRKPLCFVYPIVVAAVLLVIALGWNRIAPQIAPKPLATRILFSVAATSTMGLVLGMAFPTGMRLVERLHKDETPWFWGMNGVGSVLASSLAIMIALSYGLTTLTIVAAGCYLLLLPAMAVLVSASKTET